VSEISHKTVQNLVVGKDVDVVETEVNQLVQIADSEPILSPIYGPEERFEDALEMTREDRVKAERLLRKVEERELERAVDQIPDRARRTSKNGWLNREQ
jgi:hypothetical protein